MSGFAWIDRIHRLRSSVRTPVTLQMEATECGAASLAMVLGHHGCWIPLDRLRTLCGVSRDGSKASNLVKVARDLGMVAKGLTKDPAALRTLPLPAILFWNFNHFVVLVACHPGHAIVHDPALGRRRVTWDELDQAFTGVVLTFAPTPALQRRGRPPNVWRSLSGWLKDTRPVYALAGLITCTLLVPALILPFGTKAFVDDFLVQGRDDLVPVLIGGFLGTALLRTMLNLLRNALLGRLEIVLAARISAQTMWHLLRLPVEYFSQRFAGELAGRVAIGHRVGQLASADLPELMFQALLALVVLAIMLSLDVTLSVISLGFALLQFAILRGSSIHRETLNQRLAMDLGRKHGVSLSGLTQMESIRANGTEAIFFARWAGYYARYQRSATQLLTSVALWSAMPSGIALMETAALVWFGGMRVMEGVLTVGTVVAFQSLSMTFGEPVRRMVRLGEKVHELRGDLDRIEDVMRAPLETSLEAESGLRASSVADSQHPDACAVELDKVTFGHNPAALPLLSDFQLRVAAGQRIALVGPTGCGKSTVARLIAGIHQPWSGEVRLQGKPRAAWSHAELATYVTLVEQDVVLFEGSVAENLTLWNDTASRDVLRQAVRDACLEREVSSWPGALNAPIAEGGSNLSGGQRQRLDIARALAGRPAVLILDEATSALDPLLEWELEQNLRQRAGTCIQVAHRLSSVRDCDCIYVMQQGRIVQAGTHEALLQDRDGLYRQLYANDDHTPGGAIDVR